MLYYKARRESLKDVKWPEVFTTLEGIKLVGFAVAHFRTPRDKILQVLVPTLATANITLAVFVT